MRFHPLVLPVLLSGLLGLAACGGQQPSSLDLLTPAATAGPTTEPSTDVVPEPEMDGTFDLPWTPVPPPSVDPTVTVTATDGTVRSDYDGEQRVSEDGRTTGPCWYEVPPPGSGWVATTTCDSTPPPPTPCPDPAALAAATGDQAYLCLQELLPTEGTSFFDDVPPAQVRAAQGRSGD